MIWGVKCSLLSGGSSDKRQEENIWTEFQNDRKMSHAYSAFFSYVFLFEKKKATLLLKWIQIYANQKG